MESPDLDGMFTALIVFGCVIVGIVWGGWELIDWLLIDNVIESKEIITPEIKLIINENNQVDTLYIYKY